MKVKIGTHTVSVLDSHIKSFKSKDAFVKSQLKDLQGTLTDDEIKEVSQDMYDALFPPKKEKE